MLKLYGMTKSEQTRAFIIEKTAPIFNKKGFAGTSLSDMTDATNLTKGSIYGNFANKDEVALAVFDYNLQKLNSITSQEMAKRQSVRDKLLVFGRVYADHAELLPVGGCPILNTAVDSDDTHPQLRSKAIAAISAWKKKIVGLVANGMHAKEFSKDINPEEIAITIIALVEGGSMLSRLTDKASYRKAVMKSLEDYISQIP